MLTSLPVPDKIKIATLGRREQRSILVRDPNRIVSTAVLASPKLTDTEVENFARMQNVSEEVLRIIGTSRAWTKKYSVIAALVKNPRTPPAVSLPLMMRLVERDVKGLSVDRNVPESVRLAARKQIERAAVAQVLIGQLRLRSCAARCSGRWLARALAALARVGAPLPPHLGDAFHEHRGLLAILVAGQLLEQIDGRCRSRRRWSIASR